MMTSHSGRLVLVRIALACIAATALGGCATTGYEDDVRVGGSIYYGIGVYDPYYRPGYFPPMIGRPPGGRPPGGRPPGGRPPGGGMPSVPTLPSIPRPMPR